MMNDNINLFRRLTVSRMRISDVRECLKMSQPDFLRMLTDGMENYLHRQVTRVEFAIFAEITQKAAYSYFASPDAKDFRCLSDDMRIAMIWRLTSACDPTLAKLSPAKRAADRIFKIKAQGGIIHFTNSELADKYRNAKKGTLKFRRGPHWPDVYITDFDETNKRAVFSRNNFFLVDGLRMSLSEASKKLGYPTPAALRQKLKKENINYGEEISTMKYVRKSYIVNNVPLSTTEAALILGYSISGLSLRIKKEKIQPGDDISHMLKTRRSNRPENDQQG